MKSLGAWDYVIVGAGTAGCVLANRLSADPRRHWIWIHIPVGYLYCIGNPVGFRGYAEQCAGLSASRATVADFR